MALGVDAEVADGQVKYQKARPAFMETAVAVVDVVCVLSFALFLGRLDLSTLFRIALLCKRGLRCV